MIKDHVDFDALAKACRAWVAGKGPKPPDHAELVMVKEGDKCDGCGQPLRPGTFVQRCLADGTIGHTQCHMGTDEPGISVTYGLPGKGRVERAAGGVGRGGVGLSRKPSGGGSVE